MRPATGWIAYLTRVPFAWSAFAHMVLRIGEATPMPNDGAVASAMKANIPDAGFYFMPGIDMRNATDEQKAAWTEKYKEGPTALVVYHPTGEDAMSPRHLIIQLASDTAAFS